MQQGYAEALEKYLFRAETFTPPASWYVGLDVSLTGAAFTEPSYSGYARQAIARSTAAWTDPTGTGQIANVAAVNFPTPPTGGAAGQVVRRYFLCTTVSGSTTVFDYFTVTPSEPLEDGVAPQIPALGIVVQT